MSNPRFKLIADRYIQAHKKLAKNFNYEKLDVNDYLAWLGKDMPRTQLLCDSAKRAYALQLFQQIPDGDLSYLQGDFDGGNLTFIDLRATILGIEILKNVNLDEEDGVAIFHDNSKQKIIRFAYLDDEDVLSAFSVFRFDKSDKDEVKDYILQVAIIKNITHRVADREVIVISHPQLLYPASRVDGDLDESHAINILQEKLNSKKIFHTLSNLFGGGLDGIESSIEDVESRSRIGMLGSANFYRYLFELKAKSINLKSRGHKAESVLALDLFESLCKEENQFVIGSQSAENFVYNCTQLIETAKCTELKNHRNIFHQILNGLLIALNVIVSIFSSSNFYKISPTHSMQIMHDTQASLASLSNTKR